MQNVKKYFTEGLIQFTILLSLIGVRVDVDSYLNGPYSPLEINDGPSSAYIQTPFHSLRDNWDGYSVHPKCPELDYFFACRRLLDEVRALGSPIRFPTQLSAWLVHQVPDSSELREPPNSTSDSNVSAGLLSESTGEEANDTELLAVDESHTAAQLSEPGPYPSTGACEIPNEEVEELKGRIQEYGDEGREEPVSLTQLALSSTLEHEGLLSSGAPLSSPEDHHPPDIDQHWSQFLSLPIYEFDQLSDLDTDISSAISQDVSLRDAMVTGSVYDMIPPRGGVRTLVARQPRGPLFRLESTNSSNSSPGMTTGLAALPNAAVVNGTRNGSSSHGALEGCLDEAVFDQINLLGLGGCLETMDAQLLGILQGIDPRVLEDLDSDSGLSLESSSRGPDSPSASEVSSSSSSSFFEDEGGATGYSSEVDSLPSKSIANYDTWSPVDFSESVWHDHSYSSAAFSQPSATTFPHKAIKEEPFSDEDGEDDEDRELSRDELRTRALHVPFSAAEIVSMPVEEFLEVLEGRGLSPAQVAFLRDIRRRGKNKLAAQNCRKRKLDAITGLQEEVERLQAQRSRLLRERQHTAKALGAAGQRMEHLSRDIFSRLRDGSGRPLTPERYTLQCEANGRVVVQHIRRPSVATTSAGGKPDKRKKEKKP
ncbi:endoplasmic reticulum membrane sensor NFE2L1 isoform X1 [Salmo salar]|uniref:Endoplasmic reticulum membrane sensor NFE2L1 isoform X1 n=1 Tax=Salmo salar TaxID=8030 RepID=A0A1S3Q1N3_SALSA|nr:endoplasmic reticulum membrane sensor NFE2L1-like isoform X1 [Salmo salar]|eukprot:XP_014033796.1 PREDICTED: nuclear factor erythroid 2-related factor 1-like isoform X1 [Salmo salar]